MRNLFVSKVDHSWYRFDRLPSRLPEGITIIADTFAEAQALLMVSEKTNMFYFDNVDF